MSAVLTYTNKGVISQTDLVKQYLPLVQQIASSVHRKINYCVDLDDLVQVGIIGLLDALSKYEKQEDAKFETYASTRIRGSILDDLRKFDHLNQEDRSQYKKIQETIRKLEHKLGQKPSDTDIAKEVNISLNDYFTVIQKNQMYNFVSIDENQNESDNVIQDEESIESKLDREKMVTIISNSIKKLNEKEQLVMQLMYVEDLTTNEIADVLEISKARVSQIHSSCLVKIKTDINPS